MRSIQWQLGMLGTVSAFAFRHRETKKNLCRDGRSQDLPKTDFQPAVRHLKLIILIFNEIALYVVGKILCTIEVLPENFHWHGYSRNALLQFHQHNKPESFTKIQNGLQIQCLAQHRLSLLFHSSPYTSRIRKYRSSESTVYSLHGQLQHT